MAPNPLAPTLTDTYVRSRIDINPLAPAWFKDAMVGIILKHHEAISWTDYDLGCVTHSPHKIELLPNSVGVRQPSGRHLYSQRNAEIIESKTRPFVDMGIWEPCPFSDWSAQLVIAGNNRVCHDFTDLNRVTVRDAYPVTPMSVILNKMSGKGLISIWDADRGYYQIIMDRDASRKAAFEYKNRHYMSLRMLFGLSTAAATFDRNNEPTIRATKERLEAEVPDHDIDNYFDDNIISGIRDLGLAICKQLRSFSRSHVHMAGSSKHQKFASLISKSNSLVSSSLRKENGRTRRKWRH